MLKNLEERPFFPIPQITSLVIPRTPQKVNCQKANLTLRVLGIKIMMSAEVMENVAGTLIAKHVLGEIVRKSVRTPSDEHYLVVVMHKGVSADLQHMSFRDLAEILSCPPGNVHAHIAEHMVAGSARGGCKICKGASRELKRLILEEKEKSKSGSPSPFITLGSVSPAVRR